MVPYLRTLIGPYFTGQAGHQIVHLMSCALILHLVSHMKMFPDTVSGHTTDSDVLLLCPLMSAKYLHEACSAYFSLFYQHHDCSVKTLAVRFLDIISDSLQINQQVESCLTQRILLFHFASKFPCRAGYYERLFKKIDIKTF